MGLCNTKQENEEVNDQSSRHRKESIKVNPNNSISILEIELKQSRDYYENILQTQEDEEPENKEEGQSAMSFSKNCSFPEKSLLSHSTNEELAVGDILPNSTNMNLHIVRTSSDISFKPQFRRKSHGEGEFTIDMRIDTVKGGTSL